MYPVNDSPITVNQALACSGFDIAQNQGMSIRLVRRSSSDGEIVLIAAVSQLRGGMDIPIQANDVLSVQAPQPADRPLAAGDHLRITIHDLVAGNVATTFMKYTDGQGQVHMPLVPAVPLAGLSCDVADKAITKAYFDQNLLRDARVTVTREDITGAWFPLGAIQAGESLRVRIFDLPDGGTESSSELKVSAAGHLKLPQIKPGKVAGLNNYEVEGTAIQAGESPGVRTFDPPERSRESSLDLMVSAAGDLKLPRIKPVKVAGLDDYEAEEAIGQAYKRAGIWRMPVLTIERASRPLPDNHLPKPTTSPLTENAFSILGNVAKPGQYSLHPAGQAQSANIKAALELAGLRPEAVRAQVIMTVRQSGRYLSFHTVGDLLDNPELDVPLQRGDVLLVGDNGAAKSELGLYYVTGVARSGAYDASRHSVTMRQALVAAGYNPADGEYLTRINREGGISVMTIAELFKCEARWLYVSPGDVLCVCRRRDAMVPALWPTTRTDAGQVR